MAQVLKDIKVVEHGTFITGPFAGMMLADLGADVVKVELPGTGDPFAPIGASSTARTFSRSIATSAQSP